MILETIKPLLKYIKKAGTAALKAQKAMNFEDRRYKGDGSVLTETDKKTEDYLYHHISRIYPDANIITEETARGFNTDKKYTFVLDPIDGTDTFSQGMTGWCISLGVMDKEMMPIAGIIYSPPLDLLIFADIGKKALLNNREIPVPDPEEIISAKSNLMVPSRSQKLYDLNQFPGKLRSIGSAALHLCYPMIYPGIYGTIESPGAHIWDIAAAHSINLSLGSGFEYIDGTAFSYSHMTDGSPGGKPFLAGPKQRIIELRKVITSF